MSKIDSRFEEKSVCFLMESIIIEKYVSIEPRAMHWVDHCVCLLEIFKKAKRKEKKKMYLFQVRKLRDSKLEGHEKS